MDNLLDGYDAYGRLLLPAAVVEQLLAGQKEDKKAGKKAGKAKREGESASEFMERAKQDDEVVDAFKQIDEALEDVDLLGVNQGPRCKIFDMSEVVRFELAIDESKNIEYRSRARGLVKLLKSTGEYRQLAVLPPNWREDLDGFANRFPNFVEVIDYVKIQSALAEQSDRVVHFAMLLNGPAGTGKSMFAQALSQWIGGGYACIRYESAQSGSAMAGSSEFWSNSKPGMPFELLTERDYANPTFFLDEIDKVSAREYDPLGALYSLLEPGTARQHADLSWPFLKLDCSHINYIAASNDCSSVPVPLLSRLRRFDIPAPNAEQARAIADNIIREETERHAPSIQFAPEAIARLCQLAPRRMRQMTLEALGRALYSQRDVVQADDIAVERPARRGIGFLS